MELERWSQDPNSNSVGLGGSGHSSSQRTDTGASFKWLQQAGVQISRVFDWALGSWVERWRQLPWGLSAAQTPFTSCPDTSQTLAPLLPLPFFLFLILLALSFQLSFTLLGVCKTFCPKGAYFPEADAPVFRHIPSPVVQSPGFLRRPHASGMPQQQPGPGLQVPRLCFLLAP